jgi:hypothetical protein
MFTFLKRLRKSSPVSHKSSTRRLPLSLEALEDRQMLSANVPDIVSGIDPTTHQATVFTRTSDGSVYGSDAGGSHLVQTGQQLGGVQELLSGANPLTGGATTFALFGSGDVFTWDGTGSHLIESHLDNGGAKLLLPGISPVSGLQSTFVLTTAGDVATWDVTGSHLIESHLDNGGAKWLLPGVSPVSGLPTTFVLTPAGDVSTWDQTGSHLVESHLDNGGAKQLLPGVSLLSGLPTTYVLTPAGDVSTWDATGSHLIESHLDNGGASQLFAGTNAATGQPTTVVLLATGAACTWDQTGSHALPGRVGPGLSRQPLAGDWQLINGRQVCQFAVAGNGDLVALDSNGMLLVQLVPGSSAATDWAPIHAANVQSFAIAGNGDVVALARDGSLEAQVVPRSGAGADWVPIFAAGQVASFAIAGNGDVVALDKGGDLYAQTQPRSGASVSWTLIFAAGQVASFGIAGNGDVVALDKSGDLYVQTQPRSGASASWTLIYAAGQVTTFGILTNGDVLALDKSRNASEQVVPRSPASADWRHIGQAGIAATDGNSWFLGTTTADWAGDYAIYCINNGQLSQMPGTAIQLTTINGLVSAVTAGGVTTLLGFGHPDAATGVTYSIAQGTLFATGGPSYVDVNQGATGDCWLLSSLAEVAARAPSDITGMFTYDGTTTENGSVVGLYTVRFYDKTSGLAEYVMVDTELPAGGGQYDHPNGVLWVALAEKAYAVANGAGFVTTSHPNTNSYDALNGGWPHWALQAITGNSASTGYSFSPSDIVSNWNAGKLVVLCTQSPVSSYIVDSHCYALVNYNPSSAQPFQVFNPWGTDSAGWAPGQQNTIYGLFTANAAFLSQNFADESFGVGAAPAANLGDHGVRALELNPGTDNLLEVLRVPQTVAQGHSLSSVEQLALTPGAVNQGNHSAVVFSSIGVRSQDSRTGLQDLHGAQLDLAGLSDEQLAAFLTRRHGNSFSTLQ